MITGHRIKYSNCYHSPFWTTQSSDSKWTLFSPPKCIFQVTDNATYASWMLLIWKNGKSIVAFFSLSQFCDKNDEFCYKWLEFSIQFTRYYANLLYTVFCCIFFLSPVSIVLCDRQTDCLCCTTTATLVAISFQTLSGTDLFRFPLLYFLCVYHSLSFSPILSFSFGFNLTLISSASVKQRFVIVNILNMCMQIRMYVCKCVLLIFNSIRVLLWLWPFEIWMSMSMSMSMCRPCMPYDIRNRVIVCSLLQSATWLT